MKSQLDLIESRLQALIENSVAAILPWGNPQQMLAHQLVEAMRTNSVSRQDGTILAPNHYVIVVHPSRMPYWQANQNLLDELGHVLYQAGEDAGFHFTAPPSFTLEANGELLPNGISITSSITEEKMSQTSVLESQPDGGPDANESVPPGAFLIVNGVEVFMLTRPVINIGRRPDNHLVIDDPRVSRTHAQMRVSQGTYIIFDLNSTGGTFVNSQRISRQRLRPGDVISLAGVPLIYGQDSPASQDDPNADTAQISNNPDSDADLETDG